MAQLLEDQPRDQWDHGLIALGLAHLERSARGEEMTVWHLRAEIASLHADRAQRRRRPTGRASPRSTSSSCALDPSPMVELARAVAIGRAEGAAAGLAALPDMPGSPYAEAARGVFLAELGRRGRGARPFRAALALARTEPERRLMERRLMRLGSGPEAQQQVIDAVQLDVEVLELGVEILPLRQAALGASAV